MGIFTLKIKNKFVFEKSKTSFLSNVGYESVLCKQFFYIANSSQQKQRRQAEPMFPGCFHRSAYVRERASCFQTQ